MSWLSKLTGIHINPIKNEYSIDTSQLLKAGLIGGGLALGLGALGGWGSAAAGGAGAAGAGAGAAGAGAAGTAGAAGAGAAGASAGSFLGSYGLPLATIGSSLYGASAARSAAEQQAAAQRDANALQLQMYLQSRQDLLPYSASGIPATNALLTGLGIGADKTTPGYGSLTKPFSMADYQADPGYAFRLSEGTKALERSAAARGGLLSGGALRETQRYGQGLASQEYQSAYDRYMGQNLQRYNMLAEQQRLGQSAAAGQAAQAANYGAAGAAGLTNVGAAQAAGTIGAANALSQGAQGLMNYYSNQNLLNTLRGSTYGQPKQG